MENKLTAKQMQALQLVTRQWCDNVRLIMDEDTKRYVEWAKTLSRVKIESEFTENLEDLFLSMMEFSITLTGMQKGV